MRNTLILLSILIALALVYFLFIQGTGGTSFDPKEHAFAVKNPELIQRIEMTKVVKEQPKENVTLEKKPDGVWMVNNRYVAKDNRIENLLSTVSRLERAEGLNNEHRKVSLERIKKFHTEVKIFDTGGNLMKQYYIGSTNQYHTGNVMLLQGAENPFLMARPGLKGYLSIHYSTNIMDWRENLFMNATAEDLASATISYGKDGATVRISRESEAAGWRVNDEIPADSAKMSTYLSGFNGKVFAESFAAEKHPDLLDSLKQKTPDYTFHYTTFSGIDSRVFLFNREQNPNNMFGWIEGKDELLTIQHFVFDKYLVPVDYFLPPSI